MRADRNKLELAMARACMNAKDIAIKNDLRPVSRRGCCTHPIQEPECRADGAVQGYV